MREGACKGMGCAHRARAAGTMAGCGGVYGGV